MEEGTEKKVTIRLEDADVEAVEGGGPPTPPTNNVIPMRKVKETCWPCVLAAVGILIFAASLIWLEFIEEA